MVCKARHSTLSDRWMASIHSAECMNVFAQMEMNFHVLWLHAIRLIKPHSQTITLTTMLNKCIGTTNAHKSEHRERFLLLFAVAGCWCRCS